MKVTNVYRFGSSTLELAVIILAAFGLDSVLRSKKIPVSELVRMVSLMAFIVLSLLIVAYEIHASLVGAPHHRLWLFLSCAWVVISLAVVALALTLFKHYKKIILPGILILEAVALFLIPQLSAPRAAAIDTKPVSYLQAHLGEDRVFGLGGPLSPNYGTYFHLASINTNDLPVPKQWATYAKANLAPDANPLVFTGANQLDPKGNTPLEDFLNHITGYEYVGVAYVIAPANLITPTQATAHDLREDFNDGNYKIFRLPSPKPYFQVVHGKCSISESSFNRVLARCSQPSELLRREVYMPGWSASGYAKHPKIVQYGPLFQAVQLPVGTSIVRFRYTPPYMIWGIVLLLGGVVFIVFNYLIAPKLLNRNFLRDKE